MASRTLVAWVTLYLSSGLFCIAKGDGTRAEREASRLACEQRYCPPCSDLFTRVERDKHGRRIQQVEIHIHGEPKTGTTMMTTWALGTLARTCEHLKDTFGPATCRIDPDLTQELPFLATLTFQPGLASDDEGYCRCDTVDMVRITASAYSKHLLPVDESCRWKHPAGLTKNTFACETVGGRPVASYADIWACMQESPCEIHDDGLLHFATIRDPRAAAISTYFHALRHPNKFSYMSQTVDEEAVKSLPSVAQWVALRHILFDGLMANSSQTYWYEDANDDPIDWHFRFTHMVGLRLPFAWIKNITELRLEGPWVDKTIGPNLHPGGDEVSGARTWRDEVRPETIPELDSILRTWLPGVLLARLGIPP